MSEKSGAPLANTNAVKHGLYRAKPKDAIKAQRIRRRVSRRLRDVPSELRPIMRPVTVALVEIEDRLETMRDFLDGEGLTNSQGEPRRMVSEYRHYWKLWLELASSNGMTLASFMATRKDLLHGDALALQRWAEGDAP
jgi:hypothetical protein